MVNSSGNSLRWGAQGWVSGDELRSEEWKGITHMEWGWE